MHPNPTPLLAIRGLRAAYGKIEALKGVDIEINPGAIGRALMSRPRLLLLDEPSLGLAPLIARQIFEAIRTLNRQDGLTVLIVEQNANHALKLAHRGYVMVNGLITLAGTGAELLQRPEIRAAYLEGGRRG